MNNIIIDYELKLFIQENTSSANSILFSFDLRGNKHLCSSNANRFKWILVNSQFKSFFIILLLDEILTYSNHIKINTYAAASTTACHQD